MWRAAVSTLWVQSVIAAIAALAGEADAFVRQPRAEPAPARHRIDQQQAQPRDAPSDPSPETPSRRSGRPFRRSSSARMLGSNLLTKSATICAHTPSKFSAQPYSCA